MAFDSNKGEEYSDAEDCHSITISSPTLTSINHRTNLLHVN